MKQTKKQIRIINRKNRLEQISLDGKAYCEKHGKYLCIAEVLGHHCYNGNHGRTYCKYLEIQK